jgi:hypothetical protein
MKLNVMIMIGEILFKKEFMIIHFLKYLSDLQYYMKQIYKQI